MIQPKLLKVLLIDYNLTKSALINKALESRACKIIHTDMDRLSLLKEVDKEQPDLIVITLESPNQFIIDSLRQISKLNPRPVVIFSNSEEQGVTTTLVKLGVSAYVVGEVNANKVNSIINIALARFDEYHRLRLELESTKQKLTAQKSLEQAKLWLMETQKITEKEAYQKIRKLAMDNSQKIEEIAKKILSFSSDHKL